MTNPKPQFESQQKIQKLKNNPYNENNSKDNDSYNLDKFCFKATSEMKNCKPLEETELSKFENLEITVNQPEKKNGGFFSKTYVTYMVTTQPSLYKVRRKYSDFAWFHSTLLNLFQFCVISPIPKKFDNLRDILDVFYLKRGRYLEKCMNYLAKDPIIKNSQLFFDFLYIADEDNFVRKKKIYEKVKPITCVDDFRNKDAKVDVTISKEKELYVENIRNYANINIDLLKKLNNSFKTLYNEINPVISRMDEISSLWKELFQSSEKYCDEKKTRDCFKQMSNLFSNLSKFLKELNSIMNVDIREHFKFLRKNYASLKEMANNIETYKSNYTKANINLITKKEELFQKNDITKWEYDPHDKIDLNKILHDKRAAFSVMCKQETLNVKRLEEMYGLILNRVISEYERMIDLNGNSNQFIFYSNIKKLNKIYESKIISIEKEQQKEDDINQNNNNSSQYKISNNINESIIDELKNEKIKKQIIRRKI